MRDASGPSFSPMFPLRLRTLEMMAPPACPSLICVMMSFVTDVTMCGEAGRCHTVTGQGVPCRGVRSPPSVPGAEKSSDPFGKVCTAVKTLMGGCFEGCHEAVGHSGRMKVKLVVSGAFCQS